MMMIYYQSWRCPNCGQLYPALEHSLISSVATFSIRPIAEHVYWFNLRLKCTMPVMHATIIRICLPFIIVCWCCTGLSMARECEKQCCDLETKPLREGGLAQPAVAFCFHAWMQPLNYDCIRSRAINQSQAMKTLSFFGVPEITNM